MNHLLRAAWSSFAPIAWVLLAMIAADASARTAQSWPILSHDIRARVVPEGHHLAVTDVLEMGPSPDSAQPLRLLLHAGLTVDSADLEGTPLVVEEMKGFKPRHFWERPDYERMSDYEAARELTVLPPSSGWPRQAKITISYSGAVFDTLHPPEVAYGRGFETTSGLITERGAFLAGATFWIPWSGEHLIRYRLKTRVPKEWESLSQGKLVSRDEVGDEVEAVWQVEHPMNEAYLIAGPYVVREQAHGKVASMTYTYADTPDDLCQTYLDATGRYLDMYDEMIGPYPFAKFALVENWWQTGFGMPSFTLLGDRVIRLPFIVHTSYGHEILHNWWGNGVFVDYGEGNWCEGLTTYLADYHYKELEGEAQARDYRLNQLRGYLDYASKGGNDFPLRTFTERESASTQAVGYGKTMMVFHMARMRVGDAEFRSALRRFYQRHLFTEASWDDVVAAFDQVTGEPMTDWFEQWIGREGAPVISVAVAGEMGQGTRIELRQEEPLYEMKVRVHMGKGDEVETRVVPLAGPTANLLADASVDWVAVDPGFDLFRKLHRAEIPPSLSQGLGADSTLVVIGSGCSPQMATALRELADEWSKNQDMVVIDESEFDGPRGRGVFLMGTGEAVDELFANSRAFGDAPRELRADTGSKGNSLVASFRDAKDEEIPWTAVLPATVEVVPALGRKLPHYGRYSYLVFEGETNVEKGSWLVESSPMRIDLTEARQ